MKAYRLLLAGALAATAVLPAVAASSLANLSTRGLVGSASGSLIAGFVVEGPAAKSILIRGVGPGLAAFGVPNPAADVAINLFNSAGQLMTDNHGYLTDPNADIVALTALRTGAFPLSEPGDSATIVTLAPGAYSIEVAPGSATAPDGTALLEVYDADADGNASRIINLSTRGQVGATAGTLITGFVVDGTTAKTLLIRGVGQDLALFGITNPAAPVDINVYDSTGTLVASNSGYLNDPNAATTVQTAALVGAFPLSNAGDSALTVTLAPGAYTVEVSPTAADAPDGIGLVEVYDADNN